MAKNKESFLLYRDLIHTVDKLPDEMAGQLLKMILHYVNDLDPKTDNLLLQIAFEPIKRQLKRDLKQWENIKEKRSMAGRKGGLTTQSKNKQNKQLLDLVKPAKANQAVTVTVTDTVTVNDTVTVKEEKSNIKRAHEVLKSDQVFWEQFCMKYQKLIKDWNMFLEHYSNQVDIEQLEFVPRILRARIQNYADNWVRNVKRSDLKDSKIFPDHWDQNWVDRSTRGPNGAKIWINYCKHLREKGFIAKKVHGKIVEFVKPKEG